MLRTLWRTRSSEPPWADFLAPTCRDERNSAPVAALVTQHDLIIEHMFDTVRHRGGLGCYSRGDDMTESTAVSPTVEAARLPGRMEQPAPSANRAPPRPRKRRLSLRFSLVSLLPTGMLLLFILGLVASGPPTTPPDLNRALGWIDGLSGGGSWRSVS